MKRILKRMATVLAIVLTAISTFSLGGCAILENMLGNTADGTSSTSSSSSVGIPPEEEPITPPEEEPENPVEPPQEEVKDESYKNDPDYARYSYMPTITSTMPRIRINADGNSSWLTQYNLNDKRAGKIDYVDCKISVDRCDEEYKLTNVSAEVKVRGNATLNYEKKPIRIKFNKKTSMLGLNGGAKCKSWVLLADWKDLSMLNNDLAFYFGKTILGSDGYYSTDFRRVNVYVTDGDSEVYWGVYLLVEQQQVNEYRVNITEPEDDYIGNDIGYLLEYDGYYTYEDPALGGDYTFEMNYYNNAPLKTLSGGTTRPRVKGYTVKNDIYADSQVEFIRSYMDNLYTIAYKAVYEHEYYTFNEDLTGIVKSNYKSAEETVSAVIDVQSLADSYILQEIACDLDVDWSSVYMDVDLSASGNKKLTFEAPWDWDSCFGVRPDVNSSGMYAANRSNPWFILFINEPWFQEIIRDKWADLYEFRVLEMALNMITESKEKGKANYEANYRRWPNCLNPLPGERTDALNACKSQAEAAEILYTWLYTRLNFLNDRWGNGADVLTRE